MHEMTAESGNMPIFATMKAIIVYSGGMDSTTLLYQYRDSIGMAVTFTYGARQDEA